MTVKIMLNSIPRQASGVKEHIFQASSSWLSIIQYAAGLDFQFSHNPSLQPLHHFYSQKSDCYKDKAFANN